MQNIYKEIIRCKNLKIGGVLGTIINTEGSTYQKPGAKCFISEDGKLTGLVSGGCVEGDLKEIANQVIKQNQPRVVHYNFTGEGDILWGLGLGCNGKMDILLEPYAPISNASRADVYEQWFEGGMSHTLHTITIIKTDDPNLIGEKWIINPLSNDLDKIPIKEIVRDYLSVKNLLPIKRSLEITDNIKLEVFYDVIFPPLQLAVFGAGPDALPLVQMAKTMKWHVTLMDHRPAFLNKDNFPEADELILYSAGETPNINISENTYLVIMSHHFLQDQLMLKKVLHSKAAYIGLLGPRKRTLELMKGIDEIENLHSINDLHSPVGLDLGSQTPEEIALSIISEIAQVYRGGTGKKLTEMKGSFGFPEKGAEFLLEI